METMTEIKTDINENVEIINELPAAAEPQEKTEEKPAERPADFYTDNAQIAALKTNDEVLKATLLLEGESKKRSAIAFNMNTEQRLKEPVIKYNGSTSAFNLECLTYILNLAKKTKYSHVKISIIKDAPVRLEFITDRCNEKGDTAEEIKTLFYLAPRIESV